MLNTKRKGKTESKVVGWRSSKIGKPIYPFHTELVAFSEAALTVGAILSYLRLGRDFLELSRDSTRAQYAVL